MNSNNIIENSSSIPSNVLKSYTNSSEESKTFQALNSTNDIQNNKSENIENDIILNELNCDNSKIINNSINENSIYSSNSEKYTNIRPPEKGYTIPLSSSVDFISNKKTNYNIRSTESDIMRTYSSPSLKYPSKMTTTSSATRIPNKNYNKNYFSINPFLINTENPTKNVISTGIRPTTSIIAQPTGVDNSNIVSIPFLPQTRSHSSSSLASSSFLMQNKALVSPSLTNATATNTLSENISSNNLNNDSFSSYKKKLIVKVHDSHSQCIVPELTPRAEEEEKKEKEDNISPGVGKMYVFIIRVNCQQKLYNPYVTVHLGEQQFSTCVSSVAEGLWNEGFMFDVSIHSQFFGILSFNLYNGNVYLPDRFIGKSEIRIESLKNMPEMFDSWYELLDKNKKSPGAINIRIYYKYQDFHIPLNKELNNDLLLENIDGNDITSRDVQTREVPRNISRMGTINETEFAKFESELTSSLDKAPRNWYESIGKVFVSDEMFNVLRMIRRTLSTLGQGFNLGPTQLLEGILVLDKYYQKREPKFEEIRNSDSIVRNLPLVEKTRDMFRYSLAAYGWIGLNFVGKGKGMLADSMKKDSSIATIINFLCLSKEDILLYNFQPSKVFDQVYFIAYERRYEAVIFSIRGTLNVKDTLADLVCEYVRWNGGLVHSGVLSSAILFYKNLFNKLKEIVRKKQPKYLYLTGHSLGGGIAAVLTIMLKNVENEFHAPPGFKIECYCFAPPSSLDIELSKVYEDCIFSFINNNDIVPRLSYGSLMDLHEMVCSVIENDKENEISLIKLLSNETRAEEFINKKLNEFEKCRNNLRTQTTFNTLNLKLCPPGKAYVILNNPDRHEEVVLKETNLDDLTEIKVRKSMFQDHSFKGYLDNLQFLFESTLLNKLNLNMRMTNSPRMITEDNSSIISSSSSLSNINNFIPIKEVNEELSCNDGTSEPQFISKDYGLKKSKSFLSKKNSKSKLNQNEILDNSEINSIKSSATVSTSNINISISSEIELSKDSNKTIEEKIKNTTTTTSNNNNTNDNNNDNEDNRRNNEDKTVNIDTITKNIETKIDTTIITTKSNNNV